MIEQRRVSFSGDVGEDLLFNLELLPHLKSAAIVQKVLYHYVQRKNSIIHRGNWKILRQGDLFENYLVKFCGKASMEEEQSPLLYILLGVNGLFVLCEDSFEAIWLSKTSYL